MKRSDEQGQENGVEENDDYQEEMIPDEQYDGNRKSQNQWRPYVPSVFQREDEEDLIREQQKENDAVDYVRAKNKEFNIYGQKRE